MRRGAIAMLAVAAVLAAGCGAKLAEGPKSVEEGVLLIEERVREIRGIQNGGESPARLVTLDALPDRDSCLPPQYVKPAPFSRPFVGYDLLGIDNSSNGGDGGSAVNISGGSGNRVTTAVVAPYNRLEREILLAAANEPPALSLTTALDYVCEYVHFLQHDQFGFNLDRGSFRGRQAREAAWRGEALLIRQLYIEKYGDMHPASGMELLPSEFTNHNEHDFFSYEARFPFLQGDAFVRHLWEEGGREFDLVNGLYDSPPRSTEQILHPERYLGERDHPVSVSEYSGASLSITSENVQGEFFIRNWLLLLGVDEEQVDLAGTGWGGDTLAHIWGGREGIHWAIAWDNPETDAAEFANVLLEGLKHSDIFTPSDCLDGEAWANSAGVLAHATMRSAEHGTVSVVAAAPECSQLEGLLP